MQPAAAARSCCCAKTQSLPWSAAGMAAGTGGCCAFGIAPASQQSCCVLIWAIHQRTQCPVWREIRVGIGASGGGRGLFAPPGVQSRYWSAECDPSCVAPGPEPKGLSQTCGSAECGSWLGSCMQTELSGVLGWVRVPRGSGASQAGGRSGCPTLKIVPVLCAVIAT